MTAPIIALLLGSIHASLLAVALLAMRACIGRRYAASRAAVGGVGMFCILLVTVLAFLPFPSIWSGVDSTATHTPQASELATRTDASANEAARLETQPVNLAEESANNIQLSFEWLQRVGDGFQGVTFAAGTIPQGWKYLLVVLLLGGIGVGLAKLFCALRTIRTLYQTSTFIVDQAMARMVDELKRNCGCHRSIELRETNELGSAATFGLFKSVILLPRSWSQWSEDELMAALAHEVAHIHRGDYCQRLVGQLGAVFYFYHPLVKAVVRYLIADQEFAADRVASGLRHNEQAYVRGLAKLALRYHDSFSNGKGWSSVSIMPKSSDFLARRLEMLRTKNVSTSKHMGWLVSCCASSSIMIIALLVTFLRSSDSVIGKTTEEPTTSAATPAKSATNNNSDALFSREPFDVPILPYAEQGAFLIRVGAILQNPEVQPYVDGINEGLTKALRIWMSRQDCSIDLRQIEWITGHLDAVVRGPKKPGQDAQFMLGSGVMTFRMTKASNWQEKILKYIPGATLEMYEGKSYVQLPIIPALGPVAAKLRFPDDKTIVVHNGFLRGITPVMDNVFFSEKTGQQPYAWIDAAARVDGGLITIVTDNQKIGWLDLPKEKQDWPKEAAPLVEKVKYYAIGLDWTEKGDRAGIRVQATCEEQEAVNDLHLAASIVQNRWPELFQGHNEAFDKYQALILQFFSSIRLQPSTDRDGKNFVHAKAEATMKKNEMIDILRRMYQ